MRLDPALFEPIFAPLRPVKVGFLPMPGNVGDRLIDSAARQLFREFGIRFRDIRPQELQRSELYDDIETICVSGGGNMGDMYPEPIADRKRALATGVPVVVLPQSFTNDAEDCSGYRRLYVRERASLKLAPTAALAPDLALGHLPPWTDEGVEAGTGVLLREDRERIIAPESTSLGDPVAISRTVDDYIGLASKFEHVVTDRLHFAIAALLIGRRVTLLPNSYHKNRAMYETWLGDMGCRWRSTPARLGTDGSDVMARLWKRLSVAPSTTVPWNGSPVREDGWTLTNTDGRYLLRHADGTSLRINDGGAMIWGLCDGSWTVEDICRVFAEQFERPLREIARDTQAHLNRFRELGALRLQPVSQYRFTPVARVPGGREIVVEVGKPRHRDRTSRLEANVRGSSAGDYVLYFETDRAWRKSLTRRADPFLLAVLPRAMSEGVPLRIEGAGVDRELLDRLAEYQRAWASWRPAQVQEVQVAAEEVDAKRRRDPVLSAFSGGLDSFYTLHRHQVAPDGARHRRLEAVVMALGLDIPVNDRPGFRAAVDRASPAVRDAGCELIEVATNARTNLPNWEMEHGAVLAAVLHLFSGSFGAGLIPATAPYRLLFPWGSNPVTDPLLGGAFEIVHHGAEYLRMEKLRALGDRPDILARLRVCWEGSDPGKNCGKCAKCFQLAMGLTALGARLTCFETPPTPETLLKYVRNTSFGNLEALEISCILDAAEVSRVSSEWIDDLAERRHTSSQAAVIP